MLNQGATLADLGVADDDWRLIAASARSVGHMLGLLRKHMRHKTQSVTQLLKLEQCKLWVVVAAGTEPIGEVSGLVRGRYAAVDIERTLSATGANVVQELKKYPEKLGILGTVLDAKIFHLPMLTALDVARTYADDDLRARMQKANLSDKATSGTAAQDRLRKTDLCKILSAETQGTLASGGRPGSNTETAFKKLAGIAQASDVSVNRALGRALVEGGYATSFETEKNLGSGLTRRTDLCLQTPGGIVRVEMMWRAKTSRAEIANYVLTKLFNYGRAIGYLAD